MKKYNKKPQKNASPIAKVFVPEETPWGEVFVPTEPEMPPPSCEELGGGDEEAGTNKMGEDRDSCYDSQASVRPKVKDPSVRKKTHGR